MSLKDIFSWIWNVNFLYIIGVIAVLVIVGHMSEWAGSNPKKAEKLKTRIFIGALIFFAIVLVGLALSEL